MSQKTARFVVSIVATMGLLALLSQFVVYVVDQRELAVVLRFGEPVRAATKPGLYFKAPFVESVRLLPSTLQFWGDDQGDTLPDLPTKDNKKIEIVPWAVWKINDPIAFVKKMRTMDNAEKRVFQFARGAMRDIITQHDLEDLVRSTDREMKMAQTEFDSAEKALLEEALPDADIGRTQPKRSVLGRKAILDAINAAARKNLLANSDDQEGGGRGIELVDVGISHIDFVPKVRETTFQRWIAERDAISTRNVQEGEQQKQEILNMTHREVEKINGEGQKRASEIRGKADAEVIKRYADAISEVGEFYTFVRTLEAYEQSINDQTEIILTTDNDFLRQFKAIGSVGPLPSTVSPGDSAPNNSAESDTGDSPLDSTVSLSDSEQE